MGLVPQPKRDGLGHPTSPLSIYSCSLWCGSGVPTKISTEQILTNRAETIFKPEHIYTDNKQIYKNNSGLLASSGRQNNSAAAC
jgi:hypothetical protein